MDEFRLVFFVLGLIVAFSFIIVQRDGIELLLPPTVLYGGQKNTISFILMNNYKDRVLYNSGFCWSEFFEKERIDTEILEPKNRTIEFGKNIVMKRKNPLFCRPQVKDVSTNITTTIRICVNLSVAEICDDMLVYIVRR